MSVIVQVGVPALSAVAVMVAGVGEILHGGKRDVERWDRAGVDAVLGQVPLLGGLDGRRGN